MTDATSHNRLYVNVWLALVAHLAGKSNLVPVGDPRLEESLGFENA